MVSQFSSRSIVAAARALAFALPAIVVLAVAPARADDAAGGPPVIASVPSTIAFQGFLTDPSGTPVNGTVNLILAIYANSSGGAALWTETQPSVPVADGVFAVGLGAVTPFPAGLFDVPSRFLGIRVNGEAELPRTPLRASPFAFRSQRADTVDGDIRISNGGSVTLETDTSFQGSFFRANHSNGSRRAWFGVSDHGGNRQDGLVVLDDAAGSPEVVIAASDSSGSLLLRNNLVSAITLDAGLEGNASVRLPPDAIASTETLDEPGVAGAINDGSVTLAGPRESVIARTITPPADGYILVTAACFVQPNHVNGTISQLQYGLSDDGVNFGAAQDVNVQVPSSAPTGNYRFPGHASGIFAATAGTPVTIHLLAEINSGAVWALGDISLNLLFVPGSYGSVTPARPAPGGGVDAEDRASRGALTPGEIAAERAESERRNQERIERELAGMRAEAAEARARITRLEQQAGVTDR